MSELEEDLGAMATPATAQALTALIAAMKLDPEYAWVWHSHIAMQLYDLGEDHRRANFLASALMDKLFEVDTTARVAALFAEG